MQTLLAMTALNMVALISPGPDFVLVVRNSLRYSHSAGRWTAFGIALGLVVHMTYCILGIGLIISKSILLFNMLKYLGAGYLVCIGIMSFLSSDEGFSIDKKQGEKKSISPRAAIRMGFCVNALNPKATLAFVSIFAAFITPETPLSIQLYFALIVISTGFLWHSFVATVFSLPKVQFVFGKARNKIDRTIGVILVSLGLRVLDV